MTNSGRKVFIFFKHQTSLVLYIAFFPLIQRMFDKHTFLFHVIKIELSYKVKKYPNPQHVYFFS